MKYIFDFDDVLLHSTPSLKERIYAVYEQNGIPRQKVEEYYTEAKKDGFSLKKMLKHFHLPYLLYAEIMKLNKKFLNAELMNFIKDLKSDDCYIVSAGDKEFQMDKIISTEIKDLFKEIHIAKNSKKDAVEKICEQFPNEKIIFIDDKKYFFEDLDLKKYPNLKTILYTGQTTAELEKEIHS